VKNPQFRIGREPISQREAQELMEAMIAVKVAAEVFSRQLGRPDPDLDRKGELVREWAGKLGHSKIAAERRRRQKTPKPPT
jgi:hypothetical protein